MLLLVQLLRERHSSPRTSRWGHLPGWTTARASGRSGERSSNRAATPQSLLPVPPGEPLDDSPLPNCPIRDVVLTDRDKHLLPKLRRDSAMALPRCVVSRHATGWAESLEGAMSGHQSWALLCRHRCRLFLAEIPKVVERNSELKQRLQRESGQISVLIGKVLEQQNSGPLRSKMGAATDRRTTRRRACVRLDSPRIHQQCREGLVGGAAQGSADCRRKRTTALIPRRSGTELVPPVWSAPRRPESPEVEGTTNWRGAPARR